MDTNSACRAASIVTDNDIAIMFENAKLLIKDWRQPSNLNKRCSKGVMWNSMKNTKVDHPESDLLLINCLREFGEFLSQDILDRLQIKYYFHHEDPIF